MDTNIKSILIDDEPKALKLLQNKLSYFKEIDILEKIDKPEDAVHSVIKNEPDLVFIDIHMPRMDGFQVLDELKRFTNLPFIIFTTAYDCYAIKAIRYYAFDYLLKPINNEELLRAITRYKKRNIGISSFQNKSRKIVGENENKIKFNSDEGIIFYDRDEIFYIQAQRNYSLLFLTNDREQQITLNLGKIEEKLRFPPFYRISRSVIINTNYIKKIHKRKKLCILKHREKSATIEIPSKKINQLNKLL
jgi:DNA-binding LytR/AlgR family response regulator